MADPNIKPNSDQMADLNTNSRKRDNGSGSSRGSNLKRGTSGDYLRKNIRNKWSFDYIYNQSKTSETVAQAQFAYYHWTEKLKESLQLEDRKKNEIRDYWTEIYQIIGFYSVFQGVIFQGVTSMASQLSCGFYKIPIILSVIASAATFVGIYIKFTNILAQNGSLNEDIKQSKAFQDRINACEEYNDVTEFNIEKIEADIEKKSAGGYDDYGDKYSKALEHANYLKWGVLAFLVAFSSIFAHLDFVVMCRGYH